MTKTRIFGMAKSSLDLNGAKRQKLELDFLRLAYACNYCLASNESARGYLAVATKAVEAQVADWQKKYCVPANLVVAFVPGLTELELAALQEEKVRNRLGNLAKAVHSGTVPEADGSVGRALMESALAAHISACNERLKIMEQPRKPQFMGIDWDFYALYDGPLPPLPPSDSPAG